MKILFVLSASIAIKKFTKILKLLSINEIFIDCIITNNAKKMIKVNEIKKIINGNIYYDESENKNKMLHITLTRKCDLIVVCPATANIIAKFSNGYANDLASTALIASNKKIMFVPAMNSEMWNNSTNQEHISRLKNIGIEFIGPEHGYLSCGEIGFGRLSEPDKIKEIIINQLQKTQILKNKKCLITAGPTIEPIDKVRFLSNYSSGKQGYEVAKQMILAGAKVTLISGPTNLQAPLGSKLIKIKTAKEMLRAVKLNSNVDIAIFAAAVSDSSPNKISKIKIKKEKLNKILLKRNKDILFEISSLKKNRPKIIVGFAAETNDHIKNAKKKLINKNCDIIVVNKIDKNNQVFGSDMNKVSLITKKTIINLRKTSKINVAKKIVDLISGIK